MGVLSPAGSCRLRLRELAPSLAEAERRVATYVVREAAKVPAMSITELAERCGASEATVVRLCKRLGLRGYQELRIRLSAELATEQPQIGGEVRRRDGLEEACRKLFGAMVAALQETLRVLDRSALAQAVERVAAARRVDLYGVGASGVVATDAALKLLRIGVQAQAFTDPHLQATSAALLGRRDVAIGVSHSGSTKDTVEALRVARGSGAFTVAVTQVGPSPITRVADVVLHTVAREPLLREAALGSRVAAMAVLDGLFAGVLLRRYASAIRALDRTREALVGRKY